MRSSATFLACVTLVALSVTAAAARPPDNDDRPHQSHERGDRSQRNERDGRDDRGGRSRPRISLDRAVAMAESRFRARVVRADTRSDGDRVVYVLRLLNDAGRVWTVRVDASTGAMQ